MCITCFDCYLDKHPKTTEHHKAVERLKYFDNELLHRSLTLDEGEEMRQIAGYEIPKYHWQRRLHYHPEDKWIIDHLAQHERLWLNCKTEKVS